MFFLAFLLVAGLATIIHGDITEIVGYCQDLEATLMIKYLLFFYVAVQFSRGNSRLQGAIKYVLYLDPFCSWTH